MVKQSHLLKSIQLTARNLYFHRPSLFSSLVVVALMLKTKDAVLRCAALCCAVPSSVADQQHRKARAMVNFGRGNQYLSQSMERVFGV